MFQSTPFPSWVGSVFQTSKSSCPAYLVSPSHALVPAPCLLSNSSPPSSLTLRLGSHTHNVSSLLLHPGSLSVPDLALLSLSFPLPSTRSPACLSPLTSKYSSLLCSATKVYLNLRTVNKRKCGKLSQGEVCVFLENKDESECIHSPGDPVIAAQGVEGFYLRSSSGQHHVIQDLFKLRLWLNVAMEE